MRIGSFEIEFTWYRKDKFSGAPLPIVYAITSWWSNYRIKKYKRKFKMEND